ncbi:MAG: hypothetical protein ACRCU5_15615 [Rhizobiaceae bacterium]
MALTPNHPLIDQLLAYHRDVRNTYDKVCKNVTSFMQAFAELRHWKQIILPQNSQTIKSQTKVWTGVLSKLMGLPLIWII